ncbi:hypothetical protein DQ04_21641000 [Trypanosoma grayi]|uniref:hypothetical protein n=1 Tax=Trypanosoma grayi TaxID=71804 RepID=UPI0004F445D6|nr:hypothetical protein DQ04_21641000 [Trypanosoma grayi]KEG05470.1 hypothetical protein DQ04_21641000 [Trypanosoma grayi]
MRRLWCALQGEALCVRLHRRFGNAPNRVRPVEMPREYAWRQSEREVSAIVAIAVMFVVPVWLIVLSGAEAEGKREDVRQWAQGQRRDCE